MRNEWQWHLDNRSDSSAHSFIVMRNVKRENSYIRKNPNTGTLGKFEQNCRILIVFILYRGNHHPPNRQQASLSNLWTICIDTGRGTVRARSQSNLCTRSQTADKWKGWHFTQATLIINAPPLIIATGSDTNAIGAIVSIITDKHVNQWCTVTLDTDQVVVLLDYSLVCVQPLTWHYRTYTAQHGRIGIGKGEWGVGANAKEVGEWTGDWRHLFHVGGGVRHHCMVFCRVYRSAGGRWLEDSIYTWLLFIVIKERLYIWWREFWGRRLLYYISSIYHQDG